MPIIGLLFALTLNVSAVTNTVQLTLKDCFLKAVRKSYVLANQGETLKQAEEHYQQAWQNFLPLLSISGNEYAGNTFAPMSAQTNAGSLRLTLSQPLFRGFRSISILEQSKDLMQAQNSAREWAYNQLYLDTAQVFYNLVNIRKQLEHLQNQVQLYNQRIKEIDAWVRIGRSRASDLSSVKAARALSYSQQVQMEGQLSNAQELFQFLTDITNSVTLVSETNLPDNTPDLSRFLENLDERPDLKAAKYQTFSAHKAIDIANSDRLPWADLGLSTGNSQLWNNSPWNWNIQLTLTYSLFADTFVQSKIREAESISRQSDDVYQLLSEGIRRDIRVSYAAFMSYLEQIKSYREAIKYLEDNYRLMERDYRLGAVKITDVLTAYSSYEDSVRNLDALIFSAQLEWLQLCVYAGQFSLPAEVKL